MLLIAILRLAVEVTTVVVRITIELLVLTARALGWLLANVIVPGTAALYGAVMASTLAWSERRRRGEEFTANQPWPDRENV